jgi:hypothetical protein
MGCNYLLNFHQNEEGTLLLPLKCPVSIDCYDSTELRDAVAVSIEQSLYALALSGTDLRALDGVTVASDTRKAACELQSLPDGAVPLEMSDQPEEQALACGCLAHEAAHVEHEGHLYKTFPDIYGRTLDCGDRSRQTFIKALDVWSEYAACRSSAEYRPEALVDFERAFCLALDGSRSASRRWIESFRDGGRATDTFREIQQVFGDAFICAGYLFGHLHGLEVHEPQEGSAARQLLSENPSVAAVIGRLGRVLHQLWLSEFAWESIDVFAPIYDLICEMMALYGMAFARHGDEWRIVMSDEASGTPALRDFLFHKAKAQ